MQIINAILQSTQQIMVNMIKKISESLINSLIAVLFIVSILAFASHIHRFIEMISGLRILYLWLSVIFLILTLSLVFLKKAKKHRLKLLNTLPILLVSCSFIINLIEVLPYYISPPEQDHSIPRKNIKLMLLNVHHQNQQFRDVVNLVRKEQPDLALFLEATGRWPQELAFLSNEYQFHESIQQVQFEIYSKHSFKLENTILYGTYRGFVPLHLDLGKTAEVTLVALHTYPPRFFGKTGFDLRNDQITKGIPELTTKIEPPLIFLGDFNMDMWASPFKKMIALSGLHDAKKGSGVLPSLWIDAKLPLHSIFGLPVDNCLVSGNITVNDAYSGRHVGSDHLPMFFVLGVPEYAKK